MLAELCPDETPQLRRKLKNALIPLPDKLNFWKQGLLESVNDLLMSIFDAEHTRYRSAVNVLSALIAYCFYDHKPAIVTPAQKRLYP